MFVCIKLRIVFVVQRMLKKGNHFLLRRKLSKVVGNAHR
jgi:hypothetical protein